MNYRKMKKQCKKRLQREKHLTKSQRQFCIKNNISNYIWWDNGLSWTLMGRKWNKTLAETLKPAITKLVETVQDAFEDIENSEFARFCKNNQELFEETEDEKNNTYSVDIC